MNHLEFLCRFCVGTMIIFGLIFVGGVSMFIAAIVCEFSVCPVAVNTVALGLAGGILATCTSLSILFWYWNFLLRDRPNLCFDEF